MLACQPIRQTLTQTFAVCATTACGAGQQETAVVLQLLVHTMQPLLASLQSWLYAGLLQASSLDFFISEGQLCGCLVATCVRVYLCTAAA